MGHCTDGKSQLPSCPPPPIKLSQWLAASWAVVILVYRPALSCPSEWCCCRHTHTYYGCHVVKRKMAKEKYSATTHSTTNVTPSLLLLPYLHALGCHSASLDICPTQSYPSQCNSTDSHAGSQHRLINFYFITPAQVNENKNERSYFSLLMACMQGAISIIMPYHYQPRWEKLLQFQRGMKGK